MVHHKHAVGLADGVADILTIASSQTAAPAAIEAVAAVGEAVGADFSPSPARYYLPVAGFQTFAAEAGRHFILDKGAGAAAAVRQSVQSAACAGYYQAEVGIDWTRLQSPSSHLAAATTKLQRGGCGKLRVMEECDKDTADVLEANRVTTDEDFHSKHRLYDAAATENGYQHTNGYHPNRTEEGAFKTIDDFSDITVESVDENVVEKHPVDLKKDSKVTFANGHMDIDDVSNVEYYASNTNKNRNKHLYIDSNNKHMFEDNNFELTEKYEMKPTKLSDASYDRSYVDDIIKRTLMTSSPTPDGNRPTRQGKVVDSSRSIGSSRYDRKQQLMDVAGKFSDDIEGDDEVFNSNRRSYGSRLQQNEYTSSSLKSRHIANNYDARDRDLQDAYDHGLNSRMKAWKKELGYEGGLYGLSPKASPRTSRRFAPSAEGSFANGFDYNDYDGHNYKAVDLRTSPHYRSGIAV